jgi:hypothetical protein
MWGRRRFKDRMIRGVPESASEGDDTERAYGRLASAVEHMMDSLMNDWLT